VTLWDDGYNQYGPDATDYRHRESIPEADRCKHCDGLGLVRYKFSGCFGNTDPRGSKDWHRCWTCDGTGRKPEDESDEL
jgi:hypothetical protein